MYNLVEDIHDVALLQSSPGFYVLLPFGPNIYYVNTNRGRGIKKSWHFMTRGVKKSKNCIMYIIYEWFYRETRVKSIRFRSAQPNFFSAMKKTHITFR